MSERPPSMRHYYRPLSRHVQYHPRDWKDETDFLRGWFIRIFILGILFGAVLGLSFATLVLK